jgi:hypothetical protein
VFLCLRYFVYQIIQYFSPSLTLSRSFPQIALQRQAEVAAEEKMRVEQILEQMRRRQAPNTAIQPARPGGGQGGGSGKGENGSDDCVIS